MEFQLIKCEFGVGHWFARWWRVIPSDEHTISEITDSPDDLHSIAIDHQRLAFISSVFVLLWGVVPLLQLLLFKHPNMILEQVVFLLAFRSLQLSERSSEAWMTGFPQPFVIVCWSASDGPVPVEIQPLLIWTFDCIKSINGLPVAPDPIEIEPSRPQLRSMESGQLLSA